MKAWLSIDFEDIAHDFKREFGIPQSGALREDALRRGYAAIEDFYRKDLAGIRLTFFRPYRRSRLARRCRSSGSGGGVVVIAVVLVELVVDGQVVGAHHDLAKLWVGDVHLAGQGAAGRVAALLEHLADHELLPNEPVRISILRSAERPVSPAARSLWDTLLERASAPEAS